MPRTKSADVMKDASKSCHKIRVDSLTDVGLVLCGVLVLDQLVANNITAA